MEPDELKQVLIRHAFNKLNYTEIFNIGSGLAAYVDKHFKPIQKKDLIIGNEYEGVCRNARKAVWDGEKFHYIRYKFGTNFEETINHYEDDHDPGIDVFVPIKTI